jgi:thiol-disulfide isomerase/thioredoxin
MRPLLFLLTAVPLLGAQGLNVPCEPSSKVLRLLEALPPMDDLSIPYAQRIGALRLLAQQNPDDFFIQRAYQESFRHNYWLGDEFDRALALYRERADPLARYYEARLLMYSEPKRSREVLEGLLKEHPEFVWPHLEFVEWSSLAGHKSDDTTAHAKAFTAACPEALVADVRSMVQDAAVMRRALERRNTWLDLTSWATLWIAEENAGIGAEALQADVRTDLKRIESWPFRPYPRLRAVYREASRILHDPTVVESLQARVDGEAPDSQLASSFARDKWEHENPRPKPDDRTAYLEYEGKEAAADREHLRRWPKDHMAAYGLWRQIQSRAFSGDPTVGSAEDLAEIDRWTQLNQLSPDGGVQSPPLETDLARIYVAGKVRLEQVPKLLDLGLRKIETQEKYSISPEALPEELRARRAPSGRELTAVQTDQIRADYFLAVNRPADARTLAEQALARLKDQQGGRAQYDRTEWLRRLGDVEAAEGHPQDALVHYQASLGLPKTRLAAAESQPRVARIEQYYLAHGGTEEKWPEWASAKSNPLLPVEPMPPAFVKALPDFSAKDLGGRTWQLRDLNGKATLVNLWATWCGPCRGEHEYLQKLYETIRERRDVQVLTFSVDESAGAVRDYVKQKGYTFPVIHSPELADKLFPYVGLPTNFLVNAQGVRTSLYGYATDAEGMRRLIENLEKAAKPR